MPSLVQRVHHAVQRRRGGQEFPLQQLTFPNDSLAFHHWQQFAQFRTRIPFELRPLLALMREHDAIAGTDNGFEMPICGICFNMRIFGSHQVEHGSGGLCEFVGDAMRLTVFRHSVTVQRRGIVYDAIRLVEQLAERLLPFLVQRLDYAGDFNGERTYALALESSGAVVPA